MKLGICSIALVLLFAGIASASCPYTSDIQPTLEYNKCSLIRPTESAAVDDKLVIECIQYKSENNEWTTKPMADTGVSIRGYDEHNFETFKAEVRTDEYGRYSFTPKVPGKYVVQVLSCSYSALFEVVERLPSEEGADVELVIVDRSGEILEETTIDSLESDLKAAPLEADEHKEGLFDFVTNESEAEAKKNISSVVFAIVGLLIA